jgi:photosystem II stability/assembly factor-like uncharacterized protein
MKTKFTILLIFSVFISSYAFTQNTGWNICNAPPFNSRVDDIFMVNTITGYAVSGSGMIVKTTNSGDNWTIITQDATVYCRSVEFINTQKGFVGGFPRAGNTANILRRTIDGGNTWTDLTASIHPRARKGICGLAIPDENTIYGGGNWFEDSAYIIKSTDGGNTWTFIDMMPYATSIIDLFFINKDTGFATGKGRAPLETAIILYTTDGGVSWTTKFINDIPSEYCWKIQRLTNRTWFASIEDLPRRSPKILRSDDGGMTWELHIADPAPYNVEGIGFINPKHGWMGGDNNYSFESTDGGVTWSRVPICLSMNRVFKVNDSMLFASGSQIWKYNGDGIYPEVPPEQYASLLVHPNPVNDILTINAGVKVSTRLFIQLVDASGRMVKQIENADKLKGSYRYDVNTANLPPGTYYVVLKTHEDKLHSKIMVVH